MDRLTGKQVVALALVPFVVIGLLAIAPVPAHAMFTLERISDLFSWLR